MTESTTEASKGRYDVGSLELADPPEDLAEQESKGYAVYDRVLRRYVGEVTADKPSLAKAKTEHGHESLAIVRV